MASSGQINRRYRQKILDYTIQQIPRRTSFIKQEMYKVRKKITKINTSLYLATREARKVTIGLKFYDRPFQN